MYNQLVNKLPDERIVEIIEMAVEMEKEFISDSLPVELIGMNSAVMCQVPTHARACRCDRC